MKQDQFSRLESIAAGKGGNEGGAYLDDIGVEMFKRDGSAMTIDEYFEFCRRIVAGYRKALIEDLKNEAPF
jgi:hypothetical protein